MSVSDNKTYKLNPCGACQKRFLDPIDIRDCCYSTMGAFNGMTNSVNMRGVEPCELCTNIAVCDEKRGKTPCNRRIPKPLLRLERNYYPQLLSETRDKDQALNRCIDMCGSDKECRFRCQLHNDAVVVDDGENNEPRENFQMDSGTKDKAIKYTILSVLVIMFAVVLVKMK